MVFNLSFCACYFIATIYAVKWRFQ